MEKRLFFNISSYATRTGTLIYIPEDIIEEWLQEGEELGAVKEGDQVRVFYQKGSVRVGNKKSARGVRRGLAFQFAPLLRDYGEFRATIVEAFPEEDSFVFKLPKPASEPRKTATQIYEEIFG